MRAVGWVMPTPVSGRLFMNIVNSGTRPPASNDHYGKLKTGLIHVSCCRLPQGLSATSPSCTGIEGSHCT